MQRDMHSPQPPATEGVHRLRVRYAECDPMRVAHHGAYIAWLEEGRTELLRTSGVSYAQLEREGVFLAVVTLEATYKRPAMYDDLLEIRTRVTGVTRVKIHHAYEVRLADRAGAANAGLDLLATAKTTLACLDADGRPRPLPDWLTRA
jgi:acyl-CoA thioester hydrolase